MEQKGAGQWGGIGGRISLLESTRNPLKRLDSEK
jgi:hypothetical protein